jgi:hypothetical protein
MIKIEPFSKEENDFKDDDFVCYCFEHTKKDIENDFIDNGKSIYHPSIGNSTQMVKD